MVLSGGLRYFRELRIDLPGTYLEGTASIKARVEALPYRNRCG